MSAEQLQQALAVYESAYHHMTTRDLLLEAHEYVLRGMCVPFALMLEFKYLARRSTLMFIASSPGSPALRKYANRIVRQLHGWS